MNEVNALHCLAIALPLPNVRQKGTYIQHFIPSQTDGSAIHALIIQLRDVIASMLSNHKTLTTVHFQTDSVRATSPFNSRMVS